MAARDKTPKPFARWIAVALAFSPAWVPLWLIHGYATNLIYWDEWSSNFAGLIVRLHEGTLGLGDLFTQHAEHRIVIPKLIYLICAELFNGNPKAVMIVQWLIACATSIGLLKLGWQTQVRGLLQWFVCNLLLFSAANWENWIWSVGIQNILPMAWMIAALVLILSGLPQWWKTMLAMLCVWAASFSSGSGLACWILVGVVLAQTGGRKSILLAWVGGFALCVTAYFAGYHVFSSPQISSSPVSIGDRLEYLCIFLANVGPFTTSTVILVCTGALMLALYAGCVAGLIYNCSDHELRRRTLPWVMIGGFSVASAVLAAIFRTGLGLDQAISSRYVISAVFLPIALVMLTPMICGDGRRRFPWSVVLLAPLLLTQVLGLPRALEICTAARMARLHGKAALLLLNVLPDHALLTAEVSPNEKDILELAPKLNDYGYISPPLLKSSNADEIRQAGGDSAGRLETIGQGPGDQVQVFGWAVIPAKRSFADAVIITADDASGHPITIAISDVHIVRNDIAGQKGAAYLNCGWRVPFSLAQLPPSINVVKLHAWAIDTDTAKMLKLNGEISFAR